MKYKMVKIKWVDSSFDSATWAWIEDIKHKPIIIKSVGYVVKENKKLITIANSIGHGQVAGIITIPKCSILKIKSIK